MAKKVEYCAFGWRLKQVMERAGLSHNDFAARLGVGPGTLSGWMKGTSQPKLDVLSFIVREFGADAAWLLTGEETATAPESPAATRKLYPGYEPPSEAVKKVEQAMAEVDELHVLRASMVVLETRFNERAAQLGVYNPKIHPDVAGEGKAVRPYSRLSPDEPEDRDRG